MNAASIQAQLDRHSAAYKALEGKAAKWNKRDYHRSASDFFCLAKADLAKGDVQSAAERYITGLSIGAEAEAMA